MRKWVWYACLIAVLAAADLLGSAYYVYKNPDSFLGHCAALGFTFGTRYNPFLVGLQTVSTNLSTMLHSSDAAVAPGEADDYERPDEPAAVEEAEALELSPLDELNGLTIPVMPEANVILPDDDEDLGWFGGAFVNSQEPPLVDPALMPVVGVAGSTIVPGCMAHADCEESHDLFGWFMKSFADCMASEPMSDADIIRCWFGWLSSPSVLENQGDVETSEPADSTPPEDPYQSYHHSDCPYTGACPYSGKMPSVEPDKTDSQEQTKPMKSPKKKMKLPKEDDMEQSETPTIRPDIDTMEFRDSDRTWDDYGDPSQL